MNKNKRFLILLLLQISLYSLKTSDAFNTAEVLQKAKENINMLQRLNLLSSNMSPEYKPIDADVWLAELQRNIDSDTKDSAEKNQLLNDFGQLLYYEIKDYDFMLKGFINLLNKTPGEKETQLLYKKIQAIEEELTSKINKWKPTEAAFKSIDYYQNKTYSDIRSDLAGLVSRLAIGKRPNMQKLLDSNEATLNFAMNFFRRLVTVACYNRLWNKILKPNNLLSLDFGPDKGSTLPPIEDGMFV